MIVIGDISLVVDNGMYVYLSKEYIINPQNGNKIRI